MIELHNKTAIWEVTAKASPKFNEYKQNIEGTYFEALHCSALYNKNKSIELTTAKTLLKKYTNAFRTNNKNTAKSKALSEKIIELKALSQDEILVQLSANTYQTIEQFYTSTLFKSLQGTVKELNQINVLNQIREEISAQTESVFTKEELVDVLSQYLKTSDTKKERIKDSFLNRAFAPVFGMVCSLALLGLFAISWEKSNLDNVTRYLNDDPYTQSKDYNLCMVAKDDIPNCSQYAKVLDTHSKSLINPRSRADEQLGDEKVDLLKAATNVFNQKIYDDVESCTAKNLPDIRTMTGKLFGEPTLLFRCQSKEIFKVKSITKDIIATQNNNKTIKDSATTTNYLNEEASSAKDKQEDKLYELLSQSEEKDINLDKISAYVVMILGSLLMIFTVFKQDE